MDKKLELRIQPHIIDHLGIKMYQKVVDVVAEFVANAWDADAKHVNIECSADKIVIADDGVGMTFGECQSKFLVVGRDRRKTEQKDHSRGGRPVLGRKGIGKFAGFGIAKEVQITTISGDSGEQTSFVLDVDAILNAEDSNSVEIKILQYDDPCEKKKEQQGTRVELRGIHARGGTGEQIGKELARRFLLPAMDPEFSITIDGKAMPDAFKDAMEYVFPDALPDAEKEARKLSIDEKGWAVETFPNGQPVRWRVGFFEHPVDDEELKGIAVFARGKMAQKPFFFDLSGGMSAQHGLEYMTGQVEMDFVDDEANDLIATERQRINLQTPLGQNIQAWGIELLKMLTREWAAKRSEKKIALIKSKTEVFSERLDNLSKSEKKTVMGVISKIAQFPRLGVDRFREWANDIIVGYEKGRLKDVIEELAASKDLNEADFINILAESDVISALSIAESIKTKILTISELKQRVQSHELENKVRDYIYDRPWIIHPKWESFKKERSLENLIKDLGLEVFKDDEPYNGRVDLTLAAGSDMLLVEFMRPGLELDYDHLDRINRYVIEIRARLDSQTGENIRTLTNAYVIADKKVESSAMNVRIKQLEEDGILVKTWEGLISSALAQWKDILELLKSRHPEDKRLADL